MSSNQCGNSRVDTMEEIFCPYCKGSKMIVFHGTTSGKVSVQCGNCGKYYTADFETMKAERSGAIKNKKKR